MDPEHRHFLNLMRLPGSISAEQAAILFGIPTACIPVLVSKSFIKPLGRTIAPNAPRRFSSVDIVKLASDPKQMDRMQNILTTHNRHRNGTNVPRIGSVVRDRSEAEDYGSADQY